MRERADSQLDRVLERATDGPVGRRQHLGRRAHFVLLWLLVAFVFIAGFVVGHGALVTAGVLALAVLVAAGLLTTVDLGHLVRARAEDPVLCLASAALAGVSVRHLGAPAVLTSALVGIAGALIARSVERAEDHHAGPIYVGAFVGGTAAAVLPSFAWVLAAGALAGALWSVSREAWVGIGGKMGTLALAGVLVCYALASLAGDIGPTTPRPPDAVGAFAAVLVIAAVAAPAAWSLAYTAGWGPVLGSAVSTAAFALLVEIVPAIGFGHPQAVTTAWFSASFVGMTAPARLAYQPMLLPVGGLICGLLLLAFGSSLAGMGGIAGATALISVFALRGALAFTGRAAGRRPRSVTL